MDALAKKTIEQSCITCSLKIAAATATVAGPLLPLPPLRRRVPELHSSMRLRVRVSLRTYCGTSMLAIVDTATIRKNWKHIPKFVHLYESPNES